MPPGRAAADRLVAARAALTAWLARPLTSFHLVLAVFGLLTTFGLVMVLSASSVQSFAEDGSSYVVFHRQLLYGLAGLAVFWIGLRVPLRLARRVSLPLLIACLVLLVLVLTPLGSRINGARSWFTVGSLVSVQPSEAAKVAFALWGAHVLVAKRGVLHRWRHLLIPLVPMAVLMFGLVMLQPDLGTMITMVIILLALLWFAGAPAALFAVVLGGTAAGAFVLATVAEYRSDRLAAFLNPEIADPMDIGYQANQAMFSLADGGWWGVGLGQGRSKWMYLPNAHNDFIFAIIGEELGLIGCLVVLALFATVVYVGMRIAARNTDPWHRLLAATLTTWLVGQAAINIGYVVGLLPVTGLPLPLISSGGTSLLVTMLTFGLLANLARHEAQAVSALQAHGQGRLARLLWLPLPQPYRPPAAGQGPPGRPGRAAASPPRDGSGTATRWTSASSVHGAGTGRRMEPGVPGERSRRW
ncbi:MAG TPA: putative lipid II flippase FtsW [Pseudonocardiaceae bacterium]|nr:putative lipid II flippase FtsW [Pseudonocardiaceae bacterium]